METRHSLFVEVLVLGLVTLSVGMLIMQMYVQGLFVLLMSAYVAIKSINN